MVDERACWRREFRQARLHHEVTLLSSFKQHHHKLIKMSTHQHKPRWSFCWVASCPSQIHTQPSHFMVEWGSLSCGRAFSPDFGFLFASRLAQLPQTTKWYGCLLSFILIQRGSSQALHCQRFSEDKATIRNTSVEASHLKLQRDTKDGISSPFRAPLPFVSQTMKETATNGRPLGQLHKV